MTLLAEDVAITTTDPDSGAGLMPTYRDPMLAGAVLLDLIDAQCVTVSTESRKIIADLEWVDVDAPVTELDPLLAAALERISAQPPPRKLDRTLALLAEGLMGQLRDRLVRRGIWRRERRRRLLVVPMVGYPATDPYPAQLRDRLRGVLVEGATPTRRERALSILFSSQMQLHGLVEGKEWRVAWDRAAALVEDDPTLALVRSAVRRRCPSGMMPTP